MNGGEPLPITSKQIAALAGVSRGTVDRVLNHRPGVSPQTAEKVLQIARELGYGYAAVLGSAEYYARFGYAAAGRHGIQAPPGIPPENFMAIRLREDAGPIEGTIVYAREFGI